MVTFKVPFLTGADAVGKPTPQLPQNYEEYNLILKKYILSQLIFYFKLFHLKNV